MRQKIIDNFNIEKIKKLYQEFIFQLNQSCCKKIFKMKINLNLPDRNIFEPGNRRRILYYLNKKIN